MTNLVLYFQNTYGVRREVGTGMTEKDINIIIKQFLDEHHFKSYYTRTWINPDNSKEKYYDVGSYTEFFICYNPKGWSEL